MNSHPFSGIILALCLCVSPSLAQEIFVEAEAYELQTAAGIRQWQTRPSHSSSGEYLELLPDTRVTHADKLIKGENFSPEPGKMAILSYEVEFPVAGRYYVWVRARSTGTEDNGIHVGLDGAWPESGQRMQWCPGKGAWRWDNRQRTEAEHCGVVGQIWLDVDEPGTHQVQFSMREDGFEFDQFLVTPEAAWRPAGRTLEDRYAEAAARWTDDIRQLVQDPPTNEKVLLLGSSSIRLWGDLAEDMAPLSIKRRGFGGAKISDLVVHLPQLMGDHPWEKMVLFIGGNDVWGTEDDKTSAELRACADALVARVRESYPDVPIYFTEITPSPARAPLHEGEAMLTEVLKAACEAHKRVSFIPMTEGFLNEDGTRKPELFLEDRLHLNPDGYRIFARNLKRGLES